MNLKSRKTKYRGLYRTIFFGILMGCLFVFLMPLKKTRVGHVSMADEMGYKQSVIWLSVLYIHVLGLVVYTQYQKINNSENEQSD